MIHLRFEGKSYDFSRRELRLNGQPSDEQLKQRLAQLLDIAVSRLSAYVVDRPVTGELIVRPEAVYG